MESFLSKSLCPLPMKKSSQIPEDINKTLVQGNVQLKVLIRKFSETFTVFYIPEPLLATKDIKLNKLRILKIECTSSLLGPLTRGLQPG